jgi:hypothetical protein
LAAVVGSCCRTNAQNRLASAAGLIAKLNNLRGKLPDWRIDEHPVLHLRRKKLRIVKVKDRHMIEKMVQGGASWLMYPLI